MSNDIFLMENFEFNGKHCFIICMLVGDEIVVRAYHDKDGKNPASKFRYGYIEDNKTSKEWRNKMPKSRISYLIDLVKSDFIEGRVKL